MLPHRPHRDARSGGHVQREEPVVVPGVPGGPAARLGSASVGLFDTPEDSHKILDSGEVAHSLMTPTAAAPQVTLPRVASAISSRARRLPPYGTTVQLQALLPDVLTPGLGRNFSADCRCRRTLDRRRRSHPPPGRLRGREGMSIPAIPCVGRSPPRHRTDPTAATTSVPAITTLLFTAPRPCRTRPPVGRPPSTPHRRRGRRSGRSPTPETRRSQGAHGPWRADVHHRPCRTSPPGPRPHGVPPPPPFGSAGAAGPLPGPRPGPPGPPGPIPGPRPGPPGP